MIGKIFHELASSKVFNHLMFSSNNTNAKDQFGNSVRKAFENFIGTITSTVKKAVEIGQKMFGISKNIYDEAKGMDLSKLKAKDVYEFPKCLESIIGETYVNQINPDELVDEESDDNTLVQEVSKQIIEQSERKDELKFQIFVKKDEEINAQVIPGGKIVITTGLLRGLEEDASPEEVKSKSAIVLGYLVARASASQEIQQAKRAGLLSVIEKTVSFSLGLFFPTKTVTVKGREQVAPEDKVKVASKHLAEQSVGLGSKILLHNRAEAADDQARETALSCAREAGYNVTEEDLNETLERVFTYSDTEKYEQEIAGDFGIIAQQAAKIIA